MKIATEHTHAQNERTESVNDVVVIKKERCREEKQNKSKKKEHRWDDVREWRRI